MGIHLDWKQNLNVYIVSALRKAMTVGEVFRLHCHELCNSPIIIPQRSAQSVHVQILLPIQIDKEVYGFSSEKALIF